MQKRILLIASFILCSQFLVAQINATTATGKEVILNENGTWEYVKETDTQSQAQISEDCSNFIKKVTSKKNGYQSLVSKETLVVSDDGGHTGFGIEAFTDLRANAFVINVKAVGAGDCVNEDTINILFRDGTTIELKNDEGLNCKAKYTIYFGGSFGRQKEKEDLATKEIKTMRASTSRGSLERDFTPEQSKQLMKTISCLTTY